MHFITPAFIQIIWSYVLFCLHFPASYSQDYKYWGEQHVWGLLGATDCSTGAKGVFCVLIKGNSEVHEGASRI